MVDPIEIPTEFPINSVSTLLAFVRGKEPYGKTVLASCITVIAYGAGMSVAPKIVGSSPAPLTDPAPLDQKVSEALQQALDQHSQPQVAMGIVPWALIVDYAIQLILKKVFSA